MKFATLAALAGVSAYTVSDTTMERHYLNYLAEHGKSYATKEEYLFRLAEFTRKMKIVEEHNSKNTDDATVAINHMSDWTDDEYKATLGYKGKKARNGTVFTGSNDIPASVDWVGGTAPTLTASGVDQLVFTTRDGGTTYFGFVAGLDIKSP